MKTIVIYKSRTGFTKQYAEWIQEELNCDIADVKEMKENPRGYDCIIYGGRVHAGKIDGLENMKKIAKTEKCRLVVFATGATPNTADREIEEMMKNNFPNEEIPHFYMQSGLRYEEMGFADKTIMKLLSKVLSSKKSKSDLESGMAEAISASFDISDKKYIQPLIAYIQGDSQNS